MKEKTHLLLKQNLVPYLLSESQNNEDLTIICKNGKFCVNLFLFASVFPGLTSVIEEGLMNQEESPAVTVTDHAWHGRRDEHGRMQGSLRLRNPRDELLFSKNAGGSKWILHHLSEALAGYSLRNEP